MVNAIDAGVGHGFLAIFCMLSRALADRIQARAVRRMGELLKEFDGRQGFRGNQWKPVAINLYPGRREVAEAAGVSFGQQKTAVRVANIPAEQFEAAVESDKPPTVTALAEMGKQSRPLPEGFRQATHTHLIGAGSAAHV
jgi:hypothetical protein